MTEPTIKFPAALWLRSGVTASERARAIIKTWHALLARSEIRDMPDNEGILCTMIRDAIETAVRDAVSDEERRAWLR